MHFPLVWVTDSWSLVVRGVVMNGQYGQSQAVSCLWKVVSMTPLSLRMEYMERKIPGKTANQKTVRSL